MRLIQRLRGERTQEAATRDRSKSVCVTSFRNKPPRDVSAFKLFHRRASSAISTASDLISRRGVFSRRYYGSVEQLQQIENDGQEHIRRFRVENGESPGEKDEMFGSPRTPVLENPEYQTRWYFKYFLGKLHQNYVGLDSEKSSFFLSLVVDDTSTISPVCRAILFKKTGAKKISLPFVHNRPLTVKQILSNFAHMDRLEKGPKEVFAPEIQKDLLLCEEQEGSVNFKFGVIYMKFGQKSDDEILSNEFGSEEFQQFLNLLGDTVELRGWDKYRGGLDNKSDMTGKKSVYTVYQGHEIMFHVSTLLPYSRDNRQQVERKRHIGNDIVNVVFVDTTDTAQSEAAHALFNPTWIKSQFTHVFAVVSVDFLHQYRLTVFSDEAVPLFGPSLPCPPIFRDRQFFRDFLLVKLINGEKATFETATFAGKRHRTLEMLIKDLYDEHMPDTRMTMLNRRAFSDVLADTPRNSRAKEDARQIEFVRIGQALKLEAIVRGDAPTSLASSGISGTVFNRSPWEASCFYPEFPDYPILCADSWNDSKLVIGTEEGVFIAEGQRYGNYHRMIFDRTFFVKQLNVIEPHGVALFRGGKPGKDCKIYIFRLSELDDITHPHCRTEIKQHRMDKTKSCVLFSTSRPGGSRLKMAVAFSKKLVMYQWKRSAAWTAWCSNSDTDTIDGFVCLWETTLNETPSVMTILDNSWSPRSSVDDLRVCVGFKNQWTIISSRGTSVQTLYTVDASKAHLVTALDLYEDQEIQLLLCYNNTCHFQKMRQEDTSRAQYDFHWNSVPTDIVCAFPYVVAFTSNSMEIRLIVNGNLVHSMTMSRLQYLAGKNDIFFASPSPDFFYNKDKQHEQPKFSPPPSPSTSSGVRHLRLYRIPIQALSRSANMDYDNRYTHSTSNSQRLKVPDQPRVSRSATSSPVPLKARMAFFK